jgi:hypothetical protein
VTDIDERVRVMILDAAAELRGSAHEPAGYNEYGSVVTPGYKVEESTRPDAARVEHRLPVADLSDPDRPSSGERFAAETDACDTYASSLRAAGWLVVERYAGMTGRPFLLAYRPEPVRRGLTVGEAIIALIPGAAGVVKP